MRAAVLIAAAASSPACRREAPPPPVTPARAPARIVRFEASSSSVLGGETVTISWKTEHALSIAIELAGRGEAVAESTEQDGLAQSPPLSADASFLLRARGEDGAEVTAMTEVAIIREPSAVEILQFTASPLTLMRGGSAMISFEAANATALFLDEVNGVRLLETHARFTGAISVRPSETTRYLLTAEGTGGPKTRTLTIVVDTTQPEMPPPAGACSDPPRGPSVGWFEEVPNALPRAIVPLGTAFFGSGGGLADLDGDGILDLIVASRGAPVVVLRGLGGFTFEELPGRFGIDSRAPAAGVALGDLDGDGDPDLLLLGIERTLLYENLGGMSFRLVIDAPISMAVPAESALLADFDGDGRLDILLNTFGRDLHGATDEGRLDRLFHNDGGLEFTDVTREAGIDEHGMSWTSVWFDANRDGALDLYIANDTFSQDYGSGVRTETELVPDAFFLGRGRGILRFAESTASFGFDTRHSSMGAVVGDFDSDGILDLYISNFGKNPLYLGQRDGPFLERAEQVGVAGTKRNNTRCASAALDPDCLIISWGALLEDFDNDGVADLLVSDGGFTGGERAQPSLLFVRAGTSPLRYEERDPGLGCFDGRVMLPADLDGDGDLDLILIGRNEPVRVIETRAPPENGWLFVELEGHASNRAGIGALLTLELENGEHLLRMIGSGGMPHSTRPNEAHFGLGGEGVRSLMVRWPSGTVQTIAPVARNQRLYVIEPD